MKTRVVYMGVFSMRPSNKSLKVFLFFLALLICGTVSAQSPVPQRRMNAGELQLALKKLQVLGSVLYIAAHPDDENTLLMSYLAKEECLRTGYLSLTRGDGGQNLIGSEVGYELGVIRTQELLAARRVDGAEQYFSRANDFGYSKNSGEALTVWDKHKVLSDVVWTIRRFQPDIIITRFSPHRDGKTHGHHTASAQLALEAFRIAGDATQFSEQLHYVKPWQATRIFWNTSRWFYRGAQTFDTTGLLHVDAGKYSALLGKSYGEIAAESRTMHKSQGMGTASSIGKRIEYFEQLDGEKAEKDMFEGINRTWRRIKGGEKIALLTAEAYEKFHPENPAEILPILCEIYQHIEILQKTNSTPWLEIKKQDVKEIIRNCAGLWFDVTADDFAYVAGESLMVKIRAVNPSDSKITLNFSQMNFAENSTKIQRDAIVKSNIPLLIEEKISLKSDLELSQPYWLKNPPQKGMFDVPESEQTLIGLAENPPQLVAELTFEINGISLMFETLLMYRKTDRVRGELYRKVEIVPELTANIQENVLIFSDSASKTMTIVAKAGRKNQRGTMSLGLPKGWKAEPASHPFNFEQKNEEQRFEFNIYPSQNQASIDIQVLVNDKPVKNLKRIEYEHIPTQTVVMPTKINAVKLDITTVSRKIGYYMGSGDDIPKVLRQIGYEVTELTDENFEAQNLEDFEAIITGIKAYNSRKRIVFHQKRMLEFVKNGGTMIVQFNTTWGRVEGADDSLIAPYPLKVSRDRVTVEEAEVRILEKTHPLMNFPNTITAKDFENWIQERGLYFPNEWDQHYTAILSSNDPNEAPKDGGLLYAKYGKGVFMYTGYAFFRQLPAGVPGASRLFVNMIEAGKAD